MKNTMHDARSTIVLLVFFAVTSSGFDIDPELCRSALGMESRKIPDSSIMASSSYEEVIVGPLNSRIRTERFGGAWCPKAMISREIYEWLQIDFADLMVVTAVETQGRYGNGQGQEYAPNYMIEYQKRDGDRLWRRYRDVKGQELFKGNNETQNAEMRAFDPFVVARRIRFVPFSHHPRAICMRVEVYGCPWRDGLVSYDMRQGDTRGDDLDFSDFLYDGFQMNGHLSDGLGQLTDKRIGHSNFRLDVNSTGRRGFEWIGWRRRSSHPDQVEIQFRFDAVRNFSGVRIHANNMFSRDVRVFRSAVMHFSVGGRHFDRLHHRPVESIQPRDDADEEARYITITIDNYLARFVILVLRFDARWIMISEIDFASELAVGNFTEETEPREANMASTVAVQSESPLHETLQSKIHSKFLESVSEVEEDEGGDEEEDDSVWHRSNISTFTVVTETAAAAADHTLKRSYLAALIGTTVAVAIVTAVACVCLGVWYKRRSTFDGCRKYSSSSCSSSPLGKKSVFVVERCRLDPSSGASSLIAGGGGDGDPLCGPELHGMLDAGGTGGKTGKTKTHASRLVDERSVVQEMINEQLMHDLMTSSSSEFHRRSLPPIPSSGSGSGRTIHPLGGRVGGGGGGGDTVPLCSDGVVAGVDDLPEETLVRLPSDRIRTIEKFGDGDYTEVRTCELKRLTCHMTSSDRRSCLSDVKDDSILVIVKSLKHDASIKNRQDFEDEIKRSSKLNHQNIVRFFGLSGSDGRIEMVLEYSKYGTLHQFLQQRTTVINTSDISSKYQPPFSHGYLIYMATEIACGMKYLESCDLVHRDLATRNCLVSNELTIKVTDVASACHRYSNHYYRIPGGRTSDPIRWMAWESILLRNFTSRSDIWAFGVTLWEILTCARTLPFDHLSNEQVYDNCSHYYQSDGQQQRLSQPTGCTREVYDLMVECWKREAGQRPTFKEIHLFLSRKNLGFNPLEEVSSIGEQGIDNNNLSSAD